MLDYYVTKRCTKIFKHLAPDYSYENDMHFGNMFIFVSNYSSRHSAYEY
jgi:hypothetical protein